MAGRLPSFASGSNLVIKMGKITLAYATNLSFSDDVSHASVGGIGSYSYDALEPLQYIARGSMSIVRYDAAALDALANLDSSKVHIPERAKSATTGTGQSVSAGNLVSKGSNSLLHDSQFNPVRLLVSRSFDINVYEKQDSSGNYGAGEGGGALFRLENCRLTDYSITFNPGSLLVENVGFMCIRIVDLVSQK